MRSHTTSSFDASCGLRVFEPELFACIVVSAFCIAHDFFGPFVVMSFADRLGERRRAYKSTTDTTDNRRRREDEAIQIAKREKDDQVARRRRLIEFSADVNDESCLSDKLFKPGM